MSRLNSAVSVRRWFQYLSAFAVALALGACGGGGEGGGTSAEGIGAEGGTFSAFGVTVVVPPGAITAPNRIAISILADASGQPTPPGQAAGAVFQILPHGTSFTLPTMITLPYDSALVPAGTTPFLVNAQIGGAYVTIGPITLDPVTKTISAQVGQLGYFTVRYTPPPVPPVPPVPTVPSRATVTSITPATAIAGTATLFTVAGGNLPLTAVLALSNGTCGAASGQSSTGFSVSCTFSSTGAQTAQVSNAGFAIGSATTITVSPAPVPTVTSITNATVPFLGVATNFTVVGTLLPTTAVLAVTDGTCAPPTAQSATGFTTACTFTVIGSGKVLSVLTQAGGTVIDNTRRITVTDPIVTAISPLTATQTIPKSFTVSGTDLPTTAVMTVAGGTCAAPTAQSATSFTMLCTFTIAGSAQTLTVLNQVGGGTIDNTRAANVALWKAALNDTGITSAQCYTTGSDVLAACTDALGAITLNAAQDGMLGRDVTDPEASDGKLGFSFSSVGSFTKTECVKDNVTGLMWEGKTASGSRAGTDIYTNYSAAYNPGSLFGTATDATGYVTAVNTATLCGFSDWRLPTADELQSIVDYGVASPGPTIDSNWLPNTVGNAYWSASPYVGNPSYAWGVGFSDGLVNFNFRPDTLYVRLVR